MSSSQDAAIRAISENERWATCDHVGSLPDGHSCPKCGGTLRRCCYTLVGFYVHRDDCPEVRRRASDVA